VDGGSGCIQRGALLWIERFHSVVATLGINVRADGTDEARGALVIEDDHRIHGAQRGEDLGAVVFVVHRARGAFERAHGGVRVHGHHHRISQSAGLIEITHMARVQQIEAAVGEHQLFTRRIHLVAQAADIFGGQGLEIGGGHAVL